jgi:hypothetical protein
MAAEIVAVCPEEKTNMPELTSPLGISSTSTPRRGESPADRQTLLQSPSPAESYFIFAHRFGCGMKHSGPHATSNE